MKNSKKIKKMFSSVISAAIVILMVAGCFTSCAEPDPEIWGITDTTKSASEASTDGNIYTIEPAAGSTSTSSNEAELEGKVKALESLIDELNQENNDLTGPWKLRKVRIPRKSRA